DTATGILLGFQNSTQLDGDVRNAETFHGLGIRMIQLTYNGRLRRPPPAPAQ
ncbi:MAG: membrane dipeptidase, partial [Nocardiopsaceae bacterium]|nr:membrane dipeptidase [Nocardiopsaceae bacterium]